IGRPLERIEEVDLGVPGPGGETVKPFPITDLCGIRSFAVRFVEVRGDAIAPEGGPEARPEDVDLRGAEPPDLGRPHAPDVVALPEGHEARASEVIRVVLLEVGRVVEALLPRLILRRALRESGDVPAEP